MADDPLNETRDERRARVLVGLRAMVHESERPNFDAWVQHIEASRLNASCVHSRDAADLSLTISTAVTEGLNIVCSETEATQARTAQLMTVLAQTMGYEFARRLRQSLAPASRDNEDACQSVMAAHADAFVLGMVQCFATMAVIEAEREHPN